MTSKCQKLCVIYTLFSPAPPLLPLTSHQCDGPALDVRVFPAGCCVFQVQQRQDCRGWMRYTWARWGVFTHDRIYSEAGWPLADHWWLPFFHSRAALRFCVVFCFARTHAYRRIHTLLRYWLLILIFCLLFINKFVTFVATSSPLPFLVTVLETGCNINYS